MKFDPITVETTISRHYSTVENLIERQVHEIVGNNHRPIIIAGNGPSLKTIDYRRVPENALVMRVNNFYFEEKYYLGKHVDYVYLAGNTNVVQDSLNTLLTVQHRDEYTSGTYFARTDNIFALNKHYFPLVDVKKAFVTNKKIADYMTLRHMPPGTLPTSGVMAIFTAIAFGFKEIYIAGMDFYTGADAYAFGVGVNHAKLVGITPGKSGYSDKYHRYDVDFEAFMLANSIDGVSITSLCPGSFISSTVDLAPMLREQGSEPQEKPEGYTRDFIPVRRPQQPKAAPRQVQTTKLKSIQHQPKRLQSYGPVRRTVYHVGDALLPDMIAKPIDRFLKKIGFF